MAVHWQIQFKTPNETPYVVRIYDNNYSGNPVTLNCAPSPIETYEDSSEDIFSPVRPQTGNLNIIANSVSEAAGIVPASVLARPVEVVDTNANVVKWAGYLQDNVFTSDWNLGPLNASIPISSSLEAMKSVPFAAPSREYMSLSDILARIFVTFSLYTDIYIPSDIDYFELLFNTVVMLGDGVEGHSTYPGITDGSTPPAEMCTCYDVITEMCNFFGWTARDHGTALWFVSIGADEYKHYTIDRLQGPPVVFVEDSILSSPDNLAIAVGSNRNTYAYVPGVSYIDLCQEARTDFTIVRTNLADVNTFDAAKTTWDYMYISCLRGSGSASFKQYKVSDGSEVYSFVDLLSRGHEDSSYCGGQLAFISKEDALHRLTDSKDDNGFMPALAIKSGKTDIVASFRSVRSIKGNSFHGGLAITGDLLKYDVVDGFKPDSTGRLAYSLQWGDKYYNGTTQTWQSSSVMNTSDAGERIHGGRIEFIQFIADIAPSDFLYIKVDPTLEGEIILNIYGYGSSSQYIGFELVENLDIQGYVLYDGVIDLNTDFAENHFCKHLQYAKQSVYERNSKYATYIENGQYGESFVLNADGSFYDGGHEATLLETISDWKDHTSEQITVDSLFEQGDGDARPCDQISIGNDDYKIVYQSVKWRDGIKRYTIQKQ